MYKYRLHDVIEDEGLPLGCPGEAPLLRGTSIEQGNPDAFESCDVRDMGYIVFAIIYVDSMYQYVSYVSWSVEICFYPQHLEKSHSYHVLGNLPGFV